MALPKGFVSDEETGLPAGFVLDGGQTDEKPQQVASKEEGLASRVSREIRDIPRQIGLTARHGIEGIGDIADLVASPVRAGLNMAGADIQGRSGKALSDALGLPEPQTSTERVVGDISRLVAGSGGAIGVAGKAAQAVSGTSQAVLKAMANRPDLQAASAIGAGGAGGIVRETGGDPLAQAVAALVGGVAAPVAVSGAQRAITAGKSAADRLVGGPQLNARIDAVLDQALQSRGTSIADISGAAKSALRFDMQKAMKAGEMSPDVVRRLVDYRLTGLTPTAGPLTLDPGIVTRQKNLSALGASSNDPKLQALSQIENANARKLIENINAMGADTADDALSAGAKVAGALSAKEQAAKTKIGGLYDQARDSAGRSSMLDGKAFAKQTQAALKENLSDDFLPAGIKRRLDAIGNGEETLTVDMAEKIKTAIGKLQRNSSDGNVRYALGIVRENLDNAPLVSEGGQGAIDAFGKARAANREWMKIVEQTPALQAIRDGVEPDKFVQTYITGKGNAASVNAVSKLRDQIKDVPEAMTAVKNNIAQTLKSSALSGKADELAKFSSTAYNKALTGIGDAKLSMFFTPKEIQALKAIGRVASYEQFQPAGSAVNNSKTAAAAIANILDRIGGNPIINKLTLGTSAPVARIISGPLREVSASAEAGRLAGIPAAIGQKKPSDPMFLLPPVLAPYMVDQ